LADTANGCVGKDQRPLISLSVALPDGPLIAEPRPIAGVRTSAFTLGGQGAALLSFRMRHGASAHGDGEDLWTVVKRHSVGSVPDGRSTGLAARESSACVQGASAQFGADLIHAHKTYS
jgi:hypothetical protein